MSFRVKLRDGLEIECDTINEVANLIYANIEDQIAELRVMQQRLRLHYRIERPATTEPR